MWVKDPSPQAWDDRAARQPGTALVYAETPVNPTLKVIDLAEAAAAAHRHGAWLMVDNTFATPFCQRPLSLGADIVAHATTKYLAGHGVVVGGAVVSPHIDFIDGPLYANLKIYGGCPSPFRRLADRPGAEDLSSCACSATAPMPWPVARMAWTPIPKSNGFTTRGWTSRPDHELAVRQMRGGFGGMVSFEVRGGLAAGKALMEASCASPPWRSAWATPTR